MGDGGEDLREDAILKLGCEREAMVEANVGEPTDLAQHENPLTVYVPLIQPRLCTRLRMPWAGTKQLWQDKVSTSKSL